MNIVGIDIVVDVNVNVSVLSKVFVCFFIIFCYLLIRNEIWFCILDIFVVLLLIMWGLYLNFIVVLIVVCLKIFEGLVLIIIGLCIVFCLVIVNLIIMKFLIFCWSVCCGYIGVILMIGRYLLLLDLRVNLFFSEMLFLILVLKFIDVFFVFGEGEFIWGCFICGGGFLGLGGFFGLWFFFLICLFCLIFMKLSMFFLGGLVSVLLFILISDCIKKNRFNVIVREIINVIKYCGMIYCFWVVIEIL